MENANISVVPAAIDTVVDPADIEDAEIYGTQAAPLGAIARPRTQATERYRLIALRLEATLAARTHKTLVVTSPGRGDGKTTTTVNLGVTLARDLGRRVLLVDGDLARPRLARPLGLNPRRGLGEVLRQEARVEDVIWRLGEDELYVLPGSPSDDEGAPSLRRFAELVAQLRPRYDWILVDTPALVESADAAAFARIADGVSLVVRSGATKRDELAGALDALTDAPLLGCILNDHDGPVVPEAPTRALAVRPRYALAAREDD